MPNLRFISQNKIEAYTICLFDSQILFCKRGGSVGVNAMNSYLKRPWLVAIAAILGKIFKLHFLRMSENSKQLILFSIETNFVVVIWGIILPLNLNP